MYAILNIIDYVLMSFIIYNILISTNYLKPKVAWIPFYRYYVVLKEYHLRVYKRDYSKFFLGLLIFNIILSVYIAIISTQDSYILREAVLGNSFYIFEIIILTVITLVVGIVIELMVIFPFFETKSQKIALLTTYLVYIIIYCYYMKDMFEYFPNLIKDSIVQGEVLGNFKTVVPEYFERGYSIAITLVVFVVYLLKMSKVERGEIVIRPWVSKEKFKKMKISEIYLFKNKK